MSVHLEKMLRLTLHDFGVKTTMSVEHRTLHVSLFTASDHLLGKLEGTWWPSLHVCSVRRINVSAPSQGRGYGSSLILLGTAQAIDFGCKWSIPSFSYTMQGGPFSRYPMLLEHLLIRKLPSTLERLAPPEDVAWESPLVEMPPPHTHFNIFGNSGRLI